MVLGTASCRLVIECLKRTEAILFLLEAAKRAGTALEKEFLPSIRGLESALSKSGQMQRVDLAIRSSFCLVEYLGYMYLEEQGVWGGVSSVEYLFVLSNAGLLGFSKGDYLKALFIPVLDSTLVHHVSGESHAFRVIFQGTDFRLATPSSLQKKAWVHHIQRLQTASRK